jgi:hypothetical protein
MLPPEQEPISDYRKREARRLRSEGHTLGEIAERLGISRERVKQLVWGLVRGDPSGRVVLFGDRGSPVLSG